MERQILHYAGKVLDDEDTLGDYSLLDYNMQAEVRAGVARARLGRRGGCP